MNHLLAPEPSSPPRRGKIVVISAPSGGGKSSLIKAFLAQENARGNDAFILSVSATTRAKRATETEGVDYYYKTPEEFEALKTDHALLESAGIYDKQYGTLRDEVLPALAAGKNVIVDANLAGLIAIKEKFPRDVVSVFISPPSFPKLKERIELRAVREGEDPANVAKRLTAARSVMQEVRYYDCEIVNDQFDKALGGLSEVLLNIQQGRLPFTPEDGQLRYYQQRTLSAAAGPRGR